MQKLQNRTNRSNAVTQKRKPIVWLPLSFLNSMFLNIVWRLFTHADSEENLINIVFCIVFDLYSLSWLFTHNIAFSHTKFSKKLSGVFLLCFLKDKEIAWCWERSENVIVRRRFADVIVRSVKKETVLSLPSKKQRRKRKCLKT